MNEIMIHRRRVLELLFFVLICLSLLGCSKSTQGQATKYKFTSKNIPFINCESDFNVDNVESVPLYFINDGFVPYVDVSTYISLIEPMSQITVSDIIMHESRLTIEYNPVLFQYQFVNASIAHPEDEQYRQQMEIDFETDTVTVSSFLFFMYLGQEQVANELDTVDITGIDVTQGDPVIIPFHEYGFDFIIQEQAGNKEYLIPFHIASLLFNYGSLYKTYYNGDSIYGGGLCLYRNEIVRTSSLNGTDIPEDVRRASFNMFLIALDYFSATKQHRGIESYQNLYINKLPTIVYSNADDYYIEFTKLMYQIDDLHAELPARGYYASTPNDALPIYTGWLQTRLLEYATIVRENRQSFQETFKDGEFPPTVQIVGEDIAVLYLYQFTDTMAAEVKTQLDQLPSNIENVVIDVSMNGGGNIHSIFELLGYMTNKPIIFHNQIAIDGSSRTYTVEVDQEAYDYEWFIRTSNVSYSAANILTVLAKENNIATIIGKATSGGASPIESIILPCGFSYTVSGNFTFYSVTGSIELGVEVDYPMDSVWDEDELYSIIHQVD